MNYNMKRLYSLLNKSTITCINPKTGETKNIKSAQVVKKIKNGIRMSMLTAFIAGGVVVAGVGKAVDVVEDVKIKSNYENAVATVYNLEEDIYDSRGEYTIDYLVDSQEYCAKAYHGETFLWAMDGPLNKSCYDEDCRVCSNNRYLQNDVLEIMKEQEEYKDIVSAYEFYQSQNKGEKL